MKMISFGAVSSKLEEDSKFKRESNSALMITMGTKEGRILVYRVGSVGSATKLFTSKAGVSFGPISAIDVTPSGSDIAAASETGEMFQYDLRKKMNDQKDSSF